MSLVCPTCGSETFEQTRTTRTEYTMAYMHDQWVELSEVVVDGGDIGDHDIECSDCGDTINEVDLITEDAYSTRENG